MAKPQNCLKFSLPKDVQPAVLYGNDNSYLRRIADRAGVKVEATDNQLEISGGKASDRRAVRYIIQELAAVLRQGNRITPGLVNSLINEKLNQQPRQHDTPSISSAFKDAALRLRHKTDVGPRNGSQAEYLTKIFNNEVIFGVGPAGTGKTFLAVAFAVHAFENDPHNIKKIILTRPAVEAGERLGFLPGDMKEKIDPYMRPLYDALYELKGSQTVNNLIKDGTIEIAPLAFMRGRTLKNAVIILDEAQNTTSEQMKMFLTRMGEGSRLIITGDISQIDLPAGTRSGLVEALGTLEDIEGLAIHRFAAADVIRHPMVAKIVSAYEKPKP